MSPMSMKSASPGGFWCCSTPMFSSGCFTYRRRLRKKRTRGGTAARARPRVPSTHYLLNSSPFPLFWKPTAKCPSTTLHILLPSPYCGSPLQSVQALPSTFFSLLKGRVAESSRGRAHARHPRTALLSFPYFGSPLQSVQALPSTFFSLLPTFLHSWSPFTPVTAYDISKAQRPSPRNSSHRQSAIRARRQA